MSIRVSKLLKQLNIGLSTLNEGVMIMHLPPLRLNTKLSDEDGKFLADYFNSAEMKALDKAQLEVISCRNRLNHFFLHDIKPIEELGLMEKRLYFKWIMSLGDQNASFRYCFSVSVMECGSNGISHFNRCHIAGKAVILAACIFGILVKRNF